MPLSDAQRKAQYNWQKKGTVMIAARLQRKADADIIAITGHKTDEIAKRVYRHSMADRNDKKNLANMILK